MRVLLSEREAARNTATMNPVSPLFAHIDALEQQIPLVLNHHKQLHDAILFTYGAVALFIADMFVIALSVISDRTGLYLLVLALFLPGISCLLIAIVIAALEARSAHQLLRAEVEHITGTLVDP